MTRYVHEQPQAIRRRLEAIGCRLHPVSQELCGSDRPLLHAGSCSGERLKHALAKINERQGNRHDLAARLAKQSIEKRRIERRREQVLHELERCANGPRRRLNALRQQPRRLDRVLIYSLRRRRELLEHLAAHVNQPRGHLEQQRAVGLHFVPQAAGVHLPHALDSGDDAGNRLAARLNPRGEELRCLDAVLLDSCGRGRHLVKERAAHIDEGSAHLREQRRAALHRAPCVAFAEVPHFREQLNHTLERTRRVAYRLAAQVRRLCALLAQPGHRRGQLVHEDAARREQGLGQRGDLARESAVADER